MALINLDEIPDEASRPVLKSGQYTLRIKEAALKEYEKDGEKRQRLDYQAEVTAPVTITDAAGGQITVAGTAIRGTFWTTPKALPRLKKDLAKFGVTGVIDLDMVPSQILGKSAKAMVRANAKKLMDENTGMPVVSEDGSEIIRPTYDIAEWLAKA